MSGALASQAFEKLAFIHAFRYSVVDFGGVDWPLQINLTDISSSPSGGENPANLRFSRLTTPFREVVGSGLLAVAMIATPMVANAKDGAPVTSSTITAEQASMVSQSPAISTMSLEEIMSDETIYADRAILHFGKDIKSANILAKVLSESGTPTIAIAGGPDCGVRVILSGMTNDNFCFTQSQMNLDVGEMIKRLLPQAIARQNNMRTAALSSPNSLPR